MQGLRTKTPGRYNLTNRKKKFLLLYIHRLATSLHVTDAAYSGCMRDLLRLQIVGRLRRSFPVLAAYATSSAVVMGYASIVRISSPARRYPGRLIVGWQIARWRCRRCRRSNAPIIGNSLVVRREGFQDLSDPSAKAHGTATYPGRVVGFERLLQRFAEHLVVADSR